MDKKSKLAISTRSICANTQLYKSIELIEETQIGKLTNVFKNLTTFILAIILKPLIILITCLDLKK
uniref:Uncharacterized protein n=1 Tax=Bostrychia simpliciuscula TaxID=324754 RepID=A0A1Z1M7G8_9FLOR|nr:hypothetical protein [Bostrychia simpliciuscula]ARW62037.1 hypothetical protein [Bostrychia simpliciuscula]